MSRLISAALIGVSTLAVAAISVAPWAWGG